MKIKDIFFKNLILVLIPLVSIIIISSWFKEGKIISNTSEEELNIYHSRKTAENFSTAWNPVGTGYKTPFPVARSPVFFILGLGEQYGIPVFLRQALLLYFLMVAGVFSTYLLMRKVFNQSLVISLIGAFFYLLNVYSMTQVWKRFLYHGIFAWAYLPLFLFFWIKWIESNRIKWLIFFLLSSMLFSYTYSQPTNIFTIWIPAGLFVLVKLWQSRLKIKGIPTILLGSITGFILWGLVNIWWLYPTLTLGSSWEDTIKEIRGEDWQYHFNSLKAVSKDFPSWEVLLLRQKWYLNSSNDFVNYYHNPIIILISILVLFIVILAIIKVKSYPYRVFLLILTFVGFFISKGANFPFGHTFFYLIFSNLTFTGAFRNPYEKFGIVWLLGYSVLFSLGFSKFLSLLRPKNRYLIGIVTLFLILGILVLPFWNGEVFPKKHRLTVPEYYNEVNSYLNQNSEGRLFHIPFSLTLENSIYTWGFVGGDPSPFLFDLESITKPEMPKYHKIAVLLPKYLSDKQFPKIMHLLGVSDIVLHKDIIYPSVNINQITKSIEGWEGIENKREFGELVIYALNKELIRPRIYVAKSIVSIQSIEEGLLKILSSKDEKNNLIFVAPQHPQILNIQTNNIPKINFKKISNDHYLVEVKQTIEPFILVLNNTFDKFWQAKIEKSIVDKHFIVNGFANGWLIEKRGDYMIDIKLKVWPWD